MMTVVSVIVDISVVRILVFNFIQIKLWEESLFQPSLSNKVSRSPTNTSTNESHAAQSRQVDKVLIGHKWQEGSFITLLHQFNDLKDDPTLKSPLKYFTFNFSSQSNKQKSNQRMIRHAQSAFDNHSDRTCSFHRSVGEFGNPRECSFAIINIWRKQVR